MLALSRTALLRWSAPILVTGSFRSAASIVPRMMASEPMLRDPLPPTSSIHLTQIGDILRAKTAHQTWLCVGENDTVYSAIAKMAKGNVGSLLVVDPKAVRNVPRACALSANGVVGIISERDYVTKVVLEGRSSANTKVSEIMTPRESVHTVTPQHSVLEAMQVMIDGNVRHVPVVSHHQLCGMLSMRDLVREIVDDHREEVGQLKTYINGTY